LFAFISLVTLYKKSVLVRQLAVSLFHALRANLLCVSFMLSARSLTSLTLARSLSP